MRRPMRASSDSQKKIQRKQVSIAFSTCFRNCLTGVIDIDILLCYNCEINDKSRRTDLNNRPIFSRAGCAMQSSFVLPMNLDEEDPDPLVGGYEDLEDINLETKKEIDRLKIEIGDFKKGLFYNYVSNDIKHNAKNIGSMLSYHSLFLQCISFWIGLLDNQIVSKPEFQDKILDAKFKTLSKIIYQTAMLNSDSRTLVYSLLLQISTQYPYDLEIVSDN